MKLGNYKLPTRSDYPDIPDWWEKISKPLGKFITDIGDCLRGRFNFQENGNFEILELKVFHDADYEVQLKTLKTSPLGCFLIFAETALQPRITRFQVMSSKSIQFRVTWDTDPGSEALVRILVIGS